MRALVAEGAQTASRASAPRFPRARTAARASSGPRPRARGERLRRARKRGATRGQLPSPWARTAALRLRVHLKTVEGPAVRDGSRNRRRGVAYLPQLGVICSTEARSKAKQNDDENDKNNTF